MDKIFIPAGTAVLASGPNSVTPIIKQKYITVRDWTHEIGSGFTKCWKTNSAVLNDTDQAVLVREGMGDTEWWFCCFPNKYYLATNIVGFFVCNRDVKVL